MSPLPDRTPWRNRDPSWTLVDWENAMRQAMETPPFGALMYDLPYRTYAAMGEVLKRQPTGDQQGVALSSRVTRRIFVRLMQDLRAVQQLCVIGSASAAGSVASSVQEVAFEVAWVGQDEARAEQWLTHTDQKNPVEKWGQRMKEVLSARLGDPQAVQDRNVEEGRIYRQLCMLKHGNSILQQGLGSFVDDGEEFFAPTPLLTANTLSAVAFSMYHTLRFCLEATMDFINVSRPGTAEEVQNLVDRVGALRQELEEVQLHVEYTVELQRSAEWRSEKGPAVRLALGRIQNVVRAGATWPESP